MLSEVSPLEDCPSPVQFVGHGCAVDFHTGRENDQVEPLADHREEELDMGAQMDEEADGLVVDCDLTEEIHEIESNKAGKPTAEKTVFLEPGKRGYRLWVLKQD